MSPFKRNVTRVVIFSTIVLISAVISTAIYYLKTKTNEQTQNQLQFRQLNIASTSIDQSIRKLINISDYFKKNISCDATNMTPGVVDDKKWFRTCKSVVENRINQINQSEDLKSIKLVDIFSPKATEEISHADIGSAQRPVKHKDGTSILLGDNGETLINTQISLKINPLASQGSDLKLNHLNVALSIDSKDFIPSDMGLFSIVFITTQQGDILGRRDFFNNGTSAVDLNFASFKEILETAENRPSFGNVSSMQDVTIAGVDYRLYIQPLPKKDIWSSDAQKVLIGMVELSTINLNKLLLSPQTIMWAVLIMLLLISFTPLLKIRFVTNRYAFTKNDVSQVAISLVLVAGILSIGSSQQMFAQYFLDTKKAQAKHIHQQIINDFESEVNALVDFVFNEKHLLPSDLKEFKATNGNHRNIRNESLAFSNDTPDGINGEAQSFYILEQIGKLSEQAVFPEDSAIHYIKDDLFINAPINLSKRDYFNRTISCQTWELPSLTDKADNKTNCKHSLYIQRINNIEDGRKNTMLSMPLFEKKTEPNKEIAIFNTKLKTFSDRVLPMNFGFAVFSEDGQVLYHSNDKVSLVQNIFVETEQNQQLIETVRNQTSKKHPIALTVNYAGKEHLFVTSPMMDQTQANSIPWTLVVFYDESDMAMNNMILVFLAIFTFFVIVFPIFFLMRFLAAQSLWAKCLYFNASKQKRYRVWASFFGAVSIFCLFSMGLVDELMLRILLWLVCAFGLVVFMLRVNRCPVTIFSLVRRPHLILLAVIATVTLLSTSVDSIDLPVTWTNLVFAAIGAMILVVTYAALTNHVPHLISRKLKLQLRNNPPNDGKVRFIKNADDKRYSKGYVCYLLSLVFFTGAVPALLIVNSTHGYLLQRQAQMQSQALNESVSEYSKQQSQYLDYLEIDDEDIRVGRTSWTSPDQLEQLFLPSLMEDLSNKEYLAYIADKNTQIAPFEYSQAQNRSKYSATEQDKNSGYPWIYYSFGHMPFKPQGVSNLSDDLLDYIFSTLSIQDSLGTKLTYLALEEQTLDTSDNKKTVNMVFRPDHYMIHASSHSPNTFAGLLIILFILYKTIDDIIVKRLLGEHIPDHFRVVRPSDAYSDKLNRWPFLRKLASHLLAHQNLASDGMSLDLLNYQHIHILLLNANRKSTLGLLEELNISPYDNKTLHIKDLLETNAGLFVFADKLNFELQKQPTKVITLAIGGIDELSNQPILRNLALDLLRTLIENKRVNVILIAETAPGYRLLRQHAYAQDLKSTDDASLMKVDEKLAWSKLLSQFDKEYLWSPAQKHNISNLMEIKRVVEHESFGWHELKEVREKFYDYHKRIKSRNSSIEDIQDYWLPEQVIEFFLVQAGPLYRKHWELCTIDEKIALYQLASGAHINPANDSVLQHLIRRGFIYRDTGWTIVNESFRQFILSAESERVVADWMDMTRSGLWPVVRIPLFIIMFVLIVLVIYSSGFTFNSVLGVATTTLGIIPLLLKNIAMIRGAPVSSSE